MKNIIGYNSFLNEGHKEIGNWREFYDVVKEKSADIGRDLFKEIHEYLGKHDIKTNVEEWSNYRYIVDFRRGDECGKLFLLKDGKFAVIIRKDGRYYELNDYKDLPAILEK